MKNKLFLVFSLFICSVSNAQIKHYFNSNVIGYYNFFNKENDRVLGTIAPSYKIEKDKFGIEFFFNWRGIAYYYGDTYGPPFEGNGSIRQIFASNIGIALHYIALEKKLIKINPMLGLMRCHYDATIVKGFFSSNGWNESILYGQSEIKLGILTGVNINVPIWRGMYANTNARYALYPSAQFNKQNLILDFGLGYMFQNKKAKK